MIYIYPILHGLPNRIDLDQYADRCRLLKLIYVYTNDKIKLRDRRKDCDTIKDEIEIRYERMLKFRFEEGKAFAI